MMTKMSVGRMLGIVIEKKRRNGAGAVDRRGLVEVARHGLHGGEEDEGVVAGPAEVHHRRDRDVAEERVVLPRDRRMPKTVSRLFTRPSSSSKMLAKMSATATGVTTNGSSTLMRQKVFARSCWSRRAAMKIASDELRDRRQQEDAERVAQIEFQNMRVARIADVVVESDEVARSRQQVPFVHRDDEGVDEREESDDPNRMKKGET